MLDSQLSPGGAFIWSAVKAGAGVIVILLGLDGAADVAPAPPSTTSAKHSKTSETRRMQLPPEIATGLIKHSGRPFSTAAWAAATPANARAPLRFTCLTI